MLRLSCAQDRSCGPVGVRKDVCNACSVYTADSSVGKNTMKATIRVSRGFARLKNDQLIPFAGSVIELMTGNPVFPTPLVPLADLGAALETFNEAVEASLNGGKREIAARDQARANLLTLLRQQAAYVEGVAAGDLTKLLSSGFQAVTPHNAQIPLPKPAIQRIENPSSATLALRVGAIPTARAYEVRMSYGADGWQTVGIFTQARKIVVGNLTPGTTYAFQVRAIGGTTGSSDWSDSVSHMSM